ncbi:MAG: hypothetical protein Q8N95_03585, partial [Desulfobacterales bacterium]|nr:hypothetical protein [Desulfobacterales bacterium]
RGKRLELSMSCSFTIPLIPSHQGRGEGLLQLAHNVCYYIFSILPTPINGTFFSTPLRGRKTQEIISNLLNTI